MSQETNFTMMVGLSGSGKSYQANLISQKTGAIILSSDFLRKQMFGNEEDQSHNNEVFNELHKQIVKNLKEKKDVIMDATNITIKDRRSILAEVSRLPQIIKVAFVMTTSISLCKKNNSQRNRQVPEWVIDKQANKFQIPFYEEGFDSIKLSGWNFPLKCSQEKLDELCKKMDNYDQKNHHHLLKLRDHCEKVGNLIDDTYPIYIKTAALVHDIGKLYTQTFDVMGEAHYYNHENIGTYNLLQNLDCLCVNNQKNILKILLIVNYHMLPFQWVEENTKEKYLKIFGKENYNLLVYFNEKDKKACN